MFNFKCVLMAGVGGMMPTICRVAAIYSTNPNEPYPGSGFYIALVAFAFIGSILALAFEEKNLRQAFILGVCAPGIITNMVSGISEGSGSIGKVTQIFSSQEAYADPAPIIINNSNIKKVFFVLIQNDTYPTKDLFSVPLHMTFYSKNNTIRLRGIVNIPKYNVFYITVPADSNKVTITAGEEAKTIFLNKNRDTDMILDFKTSTNDFMWAAGLGRKVTISEFCIKNIPKEEFNVNNLLLSLPPDTKIPEEHLSDVESVHKIYKRGMVLIEGFMKATGYRERLDLAYQVTECWKTVIDHRTPNSPFYRKYNDLSNKMHNAMLSVGITKLLRQEMIKQAVQKRGDIHKQYKELK